MMAGSIGIISSTNFPPPPYRRGARGEVNPLLLSEEE